MSKREWYIAICDMGGMYAASSPAFEASTIYGPYTKDQADQAEKIGENFPDESFAVVTFKAESRPLFRSLIKTIQDQVKDAIALKDGDEFYGKDGMYRKGKDQQEPA